MYGQMAAKDRCCGKMALIVPHLIHLEAIITLQRLCESLGPKIAGKMHWTIDLRRPRLEISIRVSDENVFIGLPLTK